MSKSYTVLASLSLLQPVAHLFWVCQRKPPGCDLSLLLELRQRQAMQRDVEISAHTL